MFHLSHQLKLKFKQIIKNIKVFNTSFKLSQLIIERKIHIDRGIIKLMTTFNYLLQGSVKALRLNTAINQ